MSFQRNRKANERGKHPNEVVLSGKSMRKKINKIIGLGHPKRTVANCFLKNRINLLKLIKDGN
jgi:hypothetical protein